MLAKDYVRLWKTKTKLNNKKHTYLTCHTAWWKFTHIFERRTQQDVRIGWIFTYTSGSWTWEPMCKDGSQSCKQWRETGPTKNTEFGPEPQAASDSSWQLITHRHTNTLCLWVCVCLSLSLSPVVWMIHDDLYTMWRYTETALQCACCPLQCEESKALSLSGFITEFSLPNWN